MRSLLLYVAGGSAAGGVCRYLLTAALQPRTPTAFPLGTFVVNLTGAIAIGFVLRWTFASPAVSPEMRLLLTTGFLGGYTTFSTFSFETIALIDAGEPRKAALYVIASVVLSLLGTVLGIALAGALLARR